MRALLRIPRVAVVMLALGLLLAGPVASQESAKSLADKGSSLLDQGKVKEALACFEKAIKLYPKASDGYAGRGTLLAAAGQGAARDGEADQAHFFFSSAEADLARAAQLGPPDASVLIDLATCRYRLGKFKAARDDYSRSLAVKPTAMAYGGRAMASSRLGDDASAVQDYGKAYAMSKNGLWLYNRGNCYLRLNQPGKARNDYLTILRTCKDKATPGFDPIGKLDKGCSETRPTVGGAKDLAVNQPNPAHLGAFPEHPQTGLPAVKPQGPVFVPGLTQTLNRQ